MTGPACTWDADGVEVSPIQQRAVMRELRRALVDPELDGVVLGRALHGGQWKEGFDSAVECVDARIEHLTGHIEGLADPVPPAPTSRRGLDALDVWDSSVAPGGWVCDVCRYPVESEPCPEHQPKAYAEMRAEARATTPGDDRGRELAERPDRRTPRDELSGPYRAVSDVLDDYLMREYGRVTSHNGWDLFLDLLGEQGHEVRALAAPTETEAIPADSSASAAAASSAATCSNLGAAPAETEAGDPPEAGPATLYDAVLSALNALADDLPGEPPVILAWDPATLAGRVTDLIEKSRFLAATAPEGQADPEKLSRDLGDVLAVVRERGTYLTGAEKGTVVAALTNALDALRWAEVDRQTSKSLARRLVAAGADHENDTGEGQGATESGEPHTDSVTAARKLLDEDDTVELLARRLHREIDPMVPSLSEKDPATQEAYRAEARQALAAALVGAPAGPQAEGTAPTDSCRACGRPPGSYTRPAGSIRADDATAIECSACGGVRVVGTPASPQAEGAGETALLRRRLTEAWQKIADLHAVAYPDQSGPANGASSGAEDEAVSGSDAS